jgi:hypothetical protein
MQRLILFLVTLLGLTVFNVCASQARPATAAGDHAVIQRRRLVLVRPPDLAKRFPHKKQAVVNYPVVSGLNPAVLRRVRALFDFKNIFDYSLQEYREDAWLSEFDYVVNYNANYLLDITFSQSGSGAYPDQHSKHFLIDLRSGKLLKAADVFVAAKMAELTAKLDLKLRAELKGILEELRASHSDAEDLKIASEAQEPLAYTQENLDTFSVGSKGVTFLYDAGYPHAIQAFAPNGRYFFTYAELKPFIKPDGPLGQFIQ